SISSRSCRSFGFSSGFSTTPKIVVYPPDRRHARSRPSRRPPRSPPRACPPAATHVLALAACLLGLHGDPARCQSETGQQTQIVHTFISFAQTSSLAKVAADSGPVPMLALNTGSYGSSETATPRGIAL